MAEDQGHSGHQQTDDNSQSAFHSGANVRVSLVGLDRPLLTAIAIAFAAVAILYASWVDRDMTQKWQAAQNERVNEQMEKRLVLSHVVELQARLDAIERYGTKDHTNAKSPGR